MGIDMELMRRKLATLRGDNKGNGNSVFFRPDDGDTDIRIVPVAVSDSDSIAPFLIASRGRASNALEAVGGRSQAGGSREKQYVPTLRLDTLLHSMPEPDFVKIDVEGAELLVLNGASKITGQISPVFYIEVGQDTSADILDLLFFFQFNFHCMKHNIVFLRFFVFFFFI